MLTLRSNPSFSPIPQELSDYSLSFLVRESGALKVCSLVCKAWLASSRPHLFDTVTVNVENVDAFCYLISNQHSTIPQFVKRLCVTTRSQRHGGRVLARLAPFLGALPSVNALYVSGFHWPNGIPASEASAFSYLAQSLSNLELEAIELRSFQEVTDVLAGLPALKSLLLKQITWTTLIHRPSQHPFAKLSSPNLEKLVLRECSLTPIVKWICEQVGIPLISTLELGPIMEHEIIAVARYLAQLGGRLRHLRLSFGPEEGYENLCGFFPIPTEQQAGACEGCKLRACLDRHQLEEDEELAATLGMNRCPHTAKLTGLQTLCVDDFVSKTHGKSSAANNRTSLLLISLRSPHLQKATFGVEGSRAGDVDAQDINWHFFDRILTEGYRKDWKEIEIVYPGSMKRDAVEQIFRSRWPRCHSRGKLSFRCVPGQGERERMGGRTA